jgi:hypothetical protein
MASIALPELPVGDEFEEYVSAYFQCGGFYVDRRLIDRGADEVLELDIITTDYRPEGVPDIRLLEIKSGGWGVSDIFKVKGWMDYLQLSDGKFIVRVGREDKVLEFVIEKAKKLGIDLIHIPNLSETAEKLKSLTTLDACTGYEIKLWRFSYWTERNLLKRLYASKRKERDVRGYEALAEYFHLVNNKTFFTENIIDRVEELYRTFQKFPNISAKCASESLGLPFDDEYEEVPEEVFKETYYECRLNDMAISCFVEHRARLAILKNAIDYIIYREAGDEAKTTATDSMRIGGLERKWSRLEFLPKAFRDGLTEIAEEPYCHRYPVFWQWFLWFFGGFVLTDLKDREHELFARYTGVPASEIPNALGAYEKLFPMKRGWFVDLAPNSRIETIKMMSMPFMGVGANVRRLAYADSKDFEKIPTGGQFTVADLKKWNNVAVDLLSPEAGGPTA